MSLRRFGRRIKSKIEQGKPGTPMRRISIRINDDGLKYEWHPTKGFRRWVR